MRKSKLWISLFLSSTVTLSLPIPIFADTVTITTETTTCYVYPYEFITLNDPSDTTLKNLANVTIGDLKEVAIHDVMRGDTKISGTAEPNATVIITFPDGTEFSVKADSDGNWTCDVPSNINLSFYDKVKASQKLGEKISPTSEIIVDTPSFEIRHISSENSNSNNSVIGETSEVSPSDELTVDPMPETVIGDRQITGTGIPGATIIVTLPNGTTFTGKVASTGKWSVTIPSSSPLYGGDIISIEEKDAGGKTITNTSLALIKSTPPSTPAKHSINAIDTTATTISGTGTPGVTVTVIFPGDKKVNSTVDSTGKWSVSKPAEVTLVSGNTVTVIQKDVAGNTSESVSVTITPKSTQSKQDSIGNRVIEILNTERTNKLTFDSELYKLALIRAKQTAELDLKKQLGPTTAHLLPDGRDCKYILIDDGYKFKKTSENVGRVYTYTGEAVYNNWFNSKDHHDAMFDPIFTNVAVATYTASNGYTYAAMILTVK